MSGDLRGQRSKPAAVRSRRHSVSAGTDSHRLPWRGRKLQATPGKIVRFAEDWTISPTVINHFAYGYNRFVNNNVSYSYLDRRGLGYAAGPRKRGLSRVSRHQLVGLWHVCPGEWIVSADGRRWRIGLGVNGSNIISNDLTWIKGNHSFRFGFEGRWYYY